MHKFDEFSRLPMAAAGSWPSPRTMISELAPLSEAKKMSVFWNVET